MLDIVYGSPRQNTIKHCPKFMHLCISSISAWWFVWRICYILEFSTVSDTFNLYCQAFYFRKIKNLFMVSAKFCESYFILQVLLYMYTFNSMLNLEIFPFSIGIQK